MWASYSFANETAREIRVLGANSGSLTSASATSSHISDWQEDVLRFRASSTHQPMDVNSITGSGVTVEDITGANGAGQTSDNRRFPAASGMLGKAVGSVDDMEVTAVAGETYVDGTFALLTFANEDTGVTVTVSGDWFDSCWYTQQQAHLRHRLPPRRQQHTLSRGRGRSGGCLRGYARAHQQSHCQRWICASWLATSCGCATKTSLWAKMLCSSQ